MTASLLILVVVLWHRHRAKKRADAALTALSVRRHLEQVLR